MKRIFIALVFMILIFAIYRFYPSVRTPIVRSIEDHITQPLIKPTATAAPIPIPTPDPVCIAQGGRWEPLGLIGYSCNPPTADGGTSCTNSNMCEGNCLADHLSELYREYSSSLFLPDMARIKELNVRGEVTGTCSFWRANFSCNIFVEDGQYTVMCLD